MIKNCPVTTEDINIAEQCFGPDMGAIKEKTTRQTPNPVQDDNIEISPETREIHKNIIYVLISCM